MLASLMVAMAVALELAKPLAVASALASFKSVSIVRGLLLTVPAVVAIGYSLPPWSHRLAAMWWPSEKR